MGKSLVLRHSRSGRGRRGGGGRAGGGGDITWMVNASIINILDYEVRIVSYDMSSYL